MGVACADPALVPAPAADPSAPPPQLQRPQPPPLPVGGREMTLKSSEATPIRQVTLVVPTDAQESRHEGSMTHIVMPSLRDPVDVDSVVAAPSWWQMDAARGDRVRACANVEAVGTAEPHARCVIDVAMAMHFHLARSIAAVMLRGR